MGNIDDSNAIAVPSAYWVQVAVGALFFAASSGTAYFYNDAVNWVPIVIIGLITVALTLFASRLNSPTREYLLSFCLVAHCILLTTAFLGHQWQIDSHMAFFAILAIISTLESLGALLFGAALIAVHHFSFSFLLPSLVYPTDTGVGNFSRTVFHATIVIIETGVLLFAMNKKLAADKNAQLQRENAEENARAAQEAQRQTSEKQKTVENVMRILEKHLNELANGNLTAKIGSDLPEGYENLQVSFNKTLQTLSEAVSHVVETSSHIHQGASEISQASEDLSYRTEKQAATLEQAAAALDELTESVKSAAEGAKSIEKIVLEAQHEAEASDKVVGDAISAMTEIETSSGQISQIIGVIDDISFQTNLLALNAGVEAARAGDAGKGFAVVASEVRALAQRSAEAAKEIKTLISDSTKQVEHGVELVGGAGTALTSIVQRVTHISDLIRNMATGTTEQAVGLGEINIGVNQLDQVTQQNAAMVEESTAASHTLKLDASSLQDLVRNFKTSSSDSDLSERTHLDRSGNLEHVQFRRA